MTDLGIDVSAELKHRGKRFGYGVAIAVNIAMLVIVLNVLDWGWPAFVTDQFGEVVPWIGLSLIAAVLANLVYLLDDTPIVRSTGQILVNLITIFVSYQVLRVFPFDFSNYVFDWTVVVQVVLILTMVGSGIGVCTEAVKLVSSGPEREKEVGMSMTSESVRETGQAEAHAGKQLYRSNRQRVLAGVSGGLGEYFEVDPVWFRVGFVVLALGGGSGILIYLLLWLIVPPTPDGYTAASSGRGSITGAAVIGLVFTIVGTIALLNTVAPWMGQYIWPIVFVLGGLALLFGGLNRDNH